MAADTEGGVHPEAGEIKVNTVMGENTDEEGYQLEDEPELVKQARRRAERRNETIKKFLGLGSDEFAANAICRELVQKRERRLRRWARKLKGNSLTENHEESMNITCSPGKRPVAMDVCSPADEDIVRPLKRRRLEWFRQRLPWLRGCPTPPDDGFRYLKDVKPWTPIPITPKKTPSFSEAFQDHVVKFDEDLLESAAQTSCTEKDSNADEAEAPSLQPEARNDPILDIFISYGAANQERERDKDSTGPFGNVDCLLASDSYGHFSDQPQNQASCKSSTSDTQNAIEHGEKRRKSSVPESNMSVRCSHVEGVPSFEFSPKTKANGDMSTPSLGADTGSSMPVSVNKQEHTKRSDPDKAEKPPEIQVQEESSLGSWRVTPDPDIPSQFYTPGRESDCEKTEKSNSAYSGDFTPTQRIWKPPRAPTPYNHSPPPLDTSHNSSCRGSGIDSLNNTPLKTPVNAIGSRSSSLASPGNATLASDLLTPKSNQDGNGNKDATISSPASLQTDVPSSRDQMNTSPQSTGPPTGFGSPTGHGSEEENLIPMVQDIDLGGGSADSDDADDLGNLDGFADSENLEISKENNESPKEENRGPKLLVNNSSQVSPAFSTVVKKSKQTRQKKKRTKVPRNPGRRPRTSLCGSENGSKWVGGNEGKVRRSQRERHRPLRWWEGEKPIYERRNATMSTVVGYDAWTPEPDKKMVSLERIPSELRDGETPP